MKYLNCAEDLYAEIEKIPNPFIRTVDVGIGYYEYWGAKGYHSEIDAELIESTAVSLAIDFRLKDSLCFYSTEFISYFKEFEDGLKEVIAARQKEAISIESNLANICQVKDYSSIIKLGYMISLELFPDSRVVQKVIVNVYWADSRSS